MILGDAIRAALLASEPRDKVLLTRRAARDWRLGRLTFAFDAPMPDRPGRPARPELLAPRHMPKRRKAQSLAGRIALVHALAHIEFVAIDLALDMAGRFGGEQGPDFTGDFLRIAAEEAMHFVLLDRHLRELGSAYGEFPAHDGLWEAAADTRHDVAARLAVVPMVLEARGLDITPATINRMRQTGDERAARILERILDDEIRHVAVGTSHFYRICAERRESAENLWTLLVNRHIRGALKPPFNDSARQSAGLPRSLYNGLVTLT